MQSVNRRRFLALTAVGSVGAAVAGAVPAAAAGRANRVDRPGETSLQVHAAVGLPPGPWPAYATQIVEGRVDLKHGTGLVTSRVLAGHPGNPSAIGLPGTTRLVRITAVSRRGAEYRLQGLVEDRSQLAPGESAQVEFVVDTARNELRTMRDGHETVLRLV